MEFFILNMDGALQGLGLIGFLFFFIKGMLWLVLFALLYMGVINKGQLQKVKSSLRFWKPKRTQAERESKESHML